MNDKIKSFSFGEANITSGEGRYQRLNRPELVLVSIEDRKINKKIRRHLVISLHRRITDQTGWLKNDRVDLTLQGDDLKEGVLHISPSGYRTAKTSSKPSSRTRILIPVPSDYPRFAELTALREGTNIECDEGKIAFDMPF